MPYDNRDPKAIALVVCPTCDAPIGEACRPASMISIHMARRQAWQAVRGPIPDDVAAHRCACGHGSNYHIAEKHGAGCRLCSCEATRESVRKERPGLTQ